MVKLSIYLKASSLIEVIVSMIILLIVAGLVLMLFPQVSHKYNHYNNVKALIMIQNEFELNKTNADFKSNANDIKIQKRISPYRNNPKLGILTIEAFDSDSNRIISRSKVIIINDQSEK